MTTAEKQAKASKPVFGKDQKAQIQMVALSAIKPYWRNPRINTDAVAKVKESITRFGYLVPLVVSKDMTIIAGHTRYKAMLEIGCAEVPCVVADMTPEQEKEFRIVDNKVAEIAFWDMDLLTQELKALPDHAAMQAFFDDIDLNELLGIAAESTHPTQDAIDEVEKALDDRFEADSQRTEADYVDVPCPHCGEPVTLKREALQNLIKLKG